METSTSPAKYKIEIESGVEVPRINHARKKTPFPIDKLDVGQSFFIPETSGYGDLKKIRRRLSSLMANRSKTEGKRFKARKVIENEKLGIRVWRLV